VNKFVNDEEERIEGGKRKAGERQIGCEGEC
jgi:hypothetical protein